MNLKNKIFNFRYNRWALLAIFLLVIGGAQSCDPANCLGGTIGGFLGFLIICIGIFVFIGWIPIIGQILAIILCGYILYHGCILDEAGIRKNSKCGCSAFCENIKPENENK